MASWSSARPAHPACSGRRTAPTSATVASLALPNSTRGSVDYAPGCSLAQGRREMDAWVVGVLTGAAGGVAAGLVLTVAVRLWDGFWRRRERARQIGCFRELLVRYRTRIYDWRDPDADVRRLVHPRGGHYSELCDELQRALRGRSSRLSFDEIEQLEEALLRPFAAVQGYIPSVSWYVQTFEAAEAIHWLELPPARRDHAIFAQAAGEPGLG